MTEAFLVVGELGFALGVENIKGLGKPWVHKVDDNWTIAINAQATVQRVEIEGCMEVDLEPYTMAVWWNGWLAGLVTPRDGVIAAHPDGANEERFIADVKAATARAEADE